MNRILQSDSLALLFRVILGTVFIVASVEKMADPAAFTLSIINYKLVPTEAALVVATILPWIELLAGMAILFGMHLRGGTLVILCLMGLFTFAVASAVLRGLDISCGCFTQDPGVARVGWLKVGENIALLAAAALLLFSTSKRWTLEAYYRPKSNDLTRTGPDTSENL